MQSEFKIETEVFEGPLDLLLNLIEKRKLLINDISLAKVTDDYISYINQMEEISLGSRSNFILIASTLLLIKSKSLLPTLELTEEEEHSIEDLERRLKIYKRLKEVEPQINEIFMKNPSFFKQGNVQIEPIFAPTKSINPKEIKETIMRIIKALPKFEKVKKAVVQSVISLEEMITNLTERVKSGINMSFREFSKNTSKGEKVNIIVSFLAMLELVKQDIINVRQENDFDDIHMETRDVGTPRY